MSAFEIIEQIKELPANEQARIAEFISENSADITRPTFPSASRATQPRTSGLPTGKPSP